ncbi:AIR synthase family protein [Halobium salinum]|uniref:AIR synthase family protein n=1 Tax=Halobium salinum TaxID=1364940 RepID=A0ABD5P769_9EURY|nr:AIR synthase family protein [Halobium salinum]
MTDLGKVDRDFFDEHIYPRLGAERDDVAIGPKHGVDFGMLDLGGTERSGTTAEVGKTGLVMATDPLSILPALGFDRAARFALHVVLSDVAVSGFPPSHLAVSFTLPPEMTDAEFAEVWAAIDEECRDLGISIVTGHTARYGGVSYSWVGGATAFAVGDPEEVIRPDGARPGDAVLVTKGPAVETTGLLTSLFPEAVVEEGLDPSLLDSAQARLDETRTVRDAVAAADAGRGEGAVGGSVGDDDAGGDDGAGVTAMHDATEGGLFGAFCEVAAGASVRLTVERDRVPMRPAVRETCDALGIDPWTCTSSGTLVLTVDPADRDAVVAALESRGTPVGVVGEVEEGEGVVVDDESVEPPESDPSWDAYERLATRSAEQ